MPKIKNIIIFIAIAAAFIFAYIFFLNSSSGDKSDLVSTTGTATTQGVDSSDGSASGAEGGSPIAQNFLTTLSSIKTIKLDVSIFSDKAFASLHDSSITLTPDAIIGRLNPFAQFGPADALTSPIVSSSTTDTASSDTTTLNAPITPAAPVTTPSKPKSVKKS